MPPPPLIRKIVLVIPNFSSMNPTDPDDLRNFLELPYSELEKRNLEIKKLAESGKPDGFIKQKVVKYLTDETPVKAVTIAFTDLEGKMHMLDYDKKFFLGGYDNLTFDGSSVRGLSELRMSDLRLRPDWKSFRILPADIFGAGKVLMFGFVCGHDGKNFPSDFRGRLQTYIDTLKKSGIKANMAPEIEGFLFEGTDSEQKYDEDDGFQLVTPGGYFNALPKDRLRQFIDKVAEVQRALGFENEKDHGEVAPSSFEINYKYTEAMTACDQVLMYKLTAKQIAKLMGCTACFLPKPVMGINGSGMHVNMSLEKNGKNIFFDAKGKHGVSTIAEKFITGILYYAPELCLTLCPSVNSYRRLDPNFEAPNEIKYSNCDRSSMVRIPLGNAKSARIEVRSVSPDINPYLAMFAMLNAGMSTVEAKPKMYKEMIEKMETRRTKKLWSNIYDAISAFSKSEFLMGILGEDEMKKYRELKEAVANRSPKELGCRVKRSEIVHHHEITNQILWNDF